MTLMRICDACEEPILSTHFWSLRLRSSGPRGNSSNLKYDLCEACKRKITAIIKKKEIKEESQ